MSNSQDASYKSEEKQILDYKIQQYRVLKQISLAYAIKAYGLQFMIFTEQQGESMSPKMVKEFAATSAGTAR